MFFRNFLSLAFLTVLTLHASSEGLAQNGVGKDSATATITTTNGKIAFVWDEPPFYVPHIYTMNPDGTNLIQLTNGPDSEFGPAWSPDGCKIVFSRTTDGRSKLFVMNADGSNQISITNGPADFEPSWSPDGNKITFWTFSPGPKMIIMNSDGSDQKVLININGAIVTGSPAWSPDGKKIAFAARSADRSSHIFTMNSDGTNQRAITNPTLGPDHSPSWSPDGTKILYVGNNDGDLYTMNPDGGNQVKILSTGQQLFNPTWSPDGQKIALQISSSPSRGPNVFVMNADGSNLTGVTQNTGVSIGNGVSWQALHLAPPTLLTEENSPRAIALESVTFVRDPFSLKASPHFGSDQRTRIMVFAMNIDLLPGESVSAVSARAEDSQNRTYWLTVEYVGSFPNFSWLKQVNLVLDGPPEGGDVWITLTLRGLDSNKALVTIKPS